MSPIAKKLLISGGVVVVVLGIAISFVQSALETHMTQALTQILPTLEAESGGTITVGDANVSLLTGTVSIDGLHFTQPEPGYEDQVVEIGDCRIKASLFAAMGGSVRVSDCTISDLAVTRVRVPKPEKTEDGGSGDDGSSGDGDDPEASGGASASAGASDGESAPPKKTFIKNLEVTSVLKLKDYRIIEDLKEMGIETNITHHSLDLRLTLGLHNITLYDDGDWGTITVKGHLDGHPDKIVVDLKGDISPILKGQDPSVKIAGSISNIDIDLIEPFSVKHGIKSDPAKIEVNLDATDGVLDESLSKISYHLRNVKFFGKAGKRFKNMPIPEMVVIPVKVTGNIFDMEMVDPDPMAIIFNSILHAATNPDSLDATIDKNIKDDEVKDLVKDALKDDKVKDAVNDLLKDEGVQDLLNGLLNKD